MHFLTIFRPERPVLTIFPPYIMPNGTYERIKKKCDTLPLTAELLSCSTTQHPPAQLLNCLKQPPSLTSLPNSNSSLDFDILKSTFGNFYKCINLLTNIFTYLAILGNVELKKYISSTPLLSFFLIRIGRAIRNSK